MTFASFGLIFRPKVANVTLGNMLANVHPPNNFLHNNNKKMKYNNKRKVNWGAGGGWDEPTLGYSKASSKHFKYLFLE